MSTMGTVALKNSLTACKKSSLLSFSRTEPRELLPSVHQRVCVSLYLSSSDSEAFKLGSHSVRRKSTASDGELLFVDMNARVCWA